MSSNKHSLRSVFLGHMIILAVASLFSWTLVLIHGDYTSFKEQASSLRQNHMDAQKKLLMAKVREVTDYIEYKENLTEKRLKESLKSHVNQAHHMATGLYDQYAGSGPPAQLEKMIKEALRPIRFNQGRGYYFAFNLNGLEELYADRPELEGTNMLPMRSEDGKFVVQDMIRLCKEQGEGFYTYLWAKPGKAKGSFPKIAYVKLFEPLGWVIGTGEYLDDYRHMVQEEVLERIKDLRFDPAGYFFGSTFDGNPLFSNGTITTGSGSVQNLTDPNGVKIIQEQQKAAKRKGGGFVEYSWRKMDSETTSPKISYVLAVPEWEWIIGAGVYQDSIEPVIAAKERALFNDLKGKILRSFIVLLVLLVMVLLASRYVSGNIQATLQSLTQFFQKAATESISIDTQDLHFSEFEDIARQINLMLVERKQAEEELKASEVQWRSYVENAPYGIFVTDSEWRCVDVNPAISRITGYSREELLERKIADLIAPSKPGQTQARFQELLVTGTYAGEDAYIHKGGEVRYLTLWAVRLSGDRYLGFVDDITERRQAQAQIEKTNKLLSAVIQQAPFAIHILEGGPNSINVIVENAESARIMGLPTEGRKGIDGDNPASLSTRFFTIDGDQEIPLYRMPSIRAFRGEVVNKEEYLFCHEDGTKIMVEATASPILGSGNQIIAVCVIFQDITEKRKIEQEKAELKEQIFQSQKMESVGRLAGGVAHDFNNMLSVILGHAEMALDQTSENTPLFADLVEIQNAAMRSADLTRQLLAFARKQTITPQILDLNLAIANMLRMLQRLIGEDIDLKWLPGSGLCKIKMDPSQLDQVLANLCVNAKQAIHGGGVITIQTKCVAIGQNHSSTLSGPAPGEYILIAVSDNGEGMDKETLDHLFEPFFTTKEMGKGTGLGLATIYGIVRQNSGFIDVESKKGEGTTFTIYLPKYDGPLQDTLEAEFETIKQGNGETILLVEDEDAIMRMGEMMLNRLGYKVIAADTPGEALRIAKEKGPEIQLLFTDVVMPGMNGKDLAEAIRSSSPDLKVLYMSGYTANVIEQHGVLEENVHFVQKPFSFHDLALGVCEALADNPKH